MSFEHWNQFIESFKRRKETEKDKDGSGCGDTSGPAEGHEGAAENQCDKSNTAEGVDRQRETEGHRRPWT